MGGCQNYGPFLGTLNIKCRSIIRIPKRDHNFDNHHIGILFPYSLCTSSTMISRNLALLLLLVAAPGCNLARNWGGGSGAQNLDQPSHGGAIQQRFVPDLEHSY